MAEDKDCLCKGLGLYIDMMNAYVDFFNQEEWADSALIPISKGLVRHLETVAATPAYADRQGPAREHLNRFNEAINDAAVGKLEDMEALELIRDGIHKNPVLQQMLTCGPIYAKENETPTTKVIARAAEELGATHGTPESSLK
ncbi:hypothetical protein LCGC14_2761710, partial [marine sediment metagenome]